MDESYEARKEATEVCPWCRKEKPLSEWYGKEGADGWNPRQGPVVCAECRENPPNSDEYLEKLPMTHRKILKSLMGGANFYEAARQAGVSPSYPGNLLRERGKQVGGNEMRRAFQTLLEMEGLDIFSIARQMRILFFAQRPMWNPKTEEWDFFPDNPTQLGAMRHLTKINNLDPPKEAPSSRPAIAVKIETNLSGPPGEAPGTYTIDVAQEPEEQPQLEEGA